jgi:hypothetical protein
MENGRQREIERVARELTVRCGLLDSPKTVGKGEVERIDNETRRRLTGIVGSF